MTFFFVFCLRVFQRCPVLKAPSVRFGRIQNADTGMVYNENLAVAQLRNGVRERARDTPLPFRLRFEQRNASRAC